MKISNTSRRIKELDQIFGHFSMRLLIVYLNCKYAFTLCNMDLLHLLHIHYTCVVLLEKAHVFFSLIKCATSKFCRGTLFNYHGMLSVSHSSYLLWLKLPNIWLYYGIWHVQCTLESSDYLYPWQGRRIWTNCTSFRFLRSPFSQISFSKY